MAYPLDLVDAPITCHCWNKDGTQLAICPNSNDLIIYEVKGKNFTVLYTLSEHTQVISSCDWNFTTGQIVTCSHDRNAYVWELDPKSNEWKKQLVLLKLRRAATYVRWSPNGKTFCVATGSSKFRVCTYDPKQNWWQSYNLDNGKPTSLNVDFMPDNLHCICASTDRHFGYFAIDDNEAKVVKDKHGKRLDYCLHEYSAQGWVNACAVSPSGQWIVFTSQDAYIRFINTKDFAEDKDNALNINGLPLLSVCFISDTALIGGGFDCQPRLFVLKGNQWTDLGLIDIEGIREKADGAAAGGPNLAAKRAMFGGPKVTKTESLHNNIIVGVRKSGGFISTCANDGKIGIWPISAIKAHFSSEKIE